MNNPNKNVSITFAAGKVGGESYPGRLPRGTFFTAQYVKGGKTALYYRHFDGIVMVDDDDGDGWELRDGDNGPAMFDVRRVKVAITVENI